MMIESMAGKAAAMNGHAYDATPFSFSEDNTAIEHFGELLTRGAHAGVAPGVSCVQLFECSRSLGACLHVRLGVRCFISAGWRCCREVLYESSRLAFVLLD